MTLQTQVAARTLAMALALEPIPPPTCKDSPSPQLTPHGWIRDFPLSDNEAILWCMAALSMEEDNVHGLLWTHSSRAVGSLRVGTHCHSEYSLLGGFSAQIFQPCLLTCSPSGPSVPGPQPTVLLQLLPGWQVSIFLHSSITGRSSAEASWRSKLGAGLLPGSVTIPSGMQSHILPAPTCCHLKTTTLGTRSHLLPSRHRLSLTGSFLLQAEKQHLQLCVSCLAQLLLMPQHVRDAKGQCPCLL